MMIVHFRRLFLLFICLIFYNEHLITPEDLLMNIRLYLHFLIQVQIMIVFGFLIMIICQCFYWIIVDIENLVFKFEI